MYKNIVSAICGCLLSIGLFAQANEIDQVLGEIARNNKELQAYQSFMVSHQLELRTSNNLPDPQFSAYYLPFGTHSTGNYSEFQISQSFEFPTVYGVRRKWIDKQEEQLQLEYASLRQEVLLPAKKYCLELIFLKKRKEVEQLRLTQARQVFDQIQELFEKEQAGVLDLNKAKIAWMQDQFVIEHIENRTRNILLSLQKLNGGQPVIFDPSRFAEDHQIAPLDSIWQAKLAIDPTLRALQGNEAVSLERIQLEKTKALPNLSIGANSQGVMGEYYAGVYGGISIPLWNSRNKVKAAEAKYQYSQSHTVAITTKHYSDFQEQFNQYNLLLRKFQEYENTLKGLNSESLLLEAYKQEEISFIEYYLELQFYRQAYDKMLQMEKELNELKAELLKHQL